MIADFQTGGKFQQPPADQWRYVKTEAGETLRMVPIPNTDSWLEKIIQRHLASGTQHICVFEDANARPADPFLRSIQTRYFVIDNDVYHYLLPVEFDQGKIIQTIKQAKSWLFIGVMTSSSRRIQPNSGAPVFSSEDLKVLAARTEKIIIGAYDGESYLIWQRNPHSWGRLQKCQAQAISNEEHSNY